jgi:hypothetical protein
MDREEESVCCQEIPACVAINQESAEIEGIDIPECITDNTFMFKLLGIATFLEYLPTAIWCKGI